MNSVHILLFCHDWFSIGSYSFIYRLGDFLLGPPVQKAIYTQLTLFVMYFFFLQKRHNADSVVNKKECQGMKSHFFIVFLNSKVSVTSKSLVLPENTLLCLVSRA